MELDTLYFFKYENETDASEFITRIPCKDIMLVEPFAPDGVQIKTRYAFRFELKDKTHIFCHDYAILVNNFIRALRKGKKDQEEALRSEEQVIKKNIDQLVFQFRLKRGHEVMTFINNESSGHLDATKEVSLKPEDMVKHFAASQQNYFEILDALQAHRPFYQELFHTFADAYHTKWTEALRSCYNRSYKAMNVPLYRVTTVGHADSASYGLGAEAERQEREVRTSRFSVRPVQNGAHVDVFQPNVQQHDDSGARNTRNHEERVRQGALHGVRFAR